MNGSAPDYRSFLEGKVDFQSATGFEIDPDLINPLLKDHIKLLVPWAIRGGRRAAFLNFGMGKTSLQIEKSRLISRITNEPALINLPLGVRLSFFNDATKLFHGEHEVELKFIQSKDEMVRPKRKAGQRIHPIYLSNYEPIRDGKLDPSIFISAELDEAACFAPGTLVDTPLGPKPIEQVKIGDAILNANGVDYVRDAFRNRIKRAVRLRYSGKSIICSDNHLFFTTRGWVAAAELRPGEALVETGASMRLVRGHYPSPVLTGSAQAFLQSALLGEMAQCPAGEPGEAACEVAAAAGLRALRQIVPPQIQLPAQTALLQRPVRDISPDERARSEEEHVGATSHPRDEGQTWSGATHLVGVGRGQGGPRQGSNRCLGQDRIRERKDGGDASSSGHSSEMDWRQGPGLDRAAASAPRGTRSGVAGGAPDADQAQTVRTSVVSLSRSGVASTPDRDRSGWRIASHQDRKGAGREEDRLPSVAWLDSVEILELGSPGLDQFRDADGGVYFYDLTVARHPSFSVGGVLVHNCLRDYGSKTFQEYLPLFKDVRFKGVNTAIPAPNRLKEIIHYAGFLGVMDTGHCLTRFFQRNSEKANDLTLFPHKVDEFWRWVATWAVCARMPSDLGCSDDGYVLPKLNVTFHKVPSNHSTAGVDRDGQALMFRDPASGVQQAAAEKRDSIDARVAKMAELRAKQPGRHVVLWHDLEDERAAIEKAIPQAVSVYGTMPIEERERRLRDFMEGRISDLATKPVLNGSGANFQPHCSWEIFTGIGHKFHDYLQAIFRIWRFGQTEECDVDFIHTEAEQAIVDDFWRKWGEHKEMQDRLAGLLLQVGLDHAKAVEPLKRSIGVKRIEAAGERWRMVRNDCVLETRTMADESVGLITTSIPFEGQYEYTETYEDFGHCDDRPAFWRQMDFLTPELFRILWPGRYCCVHIKDRILFGNITGKGVPTVSPFHAEAMFHCIRHGFDFMGMITVVTDVVRENNQTYRLGYTEMLKDGSKMGVGCSEYVLLMRKPQTDRSRGYADVPIEKDPNKYSLPRWQIDAHGFWRSSGNRLLTVDELIELGPKKLASYFPRWTLQAGPYDYETHVKLGEAIEQRRPGALPRTFMALAPGSPDPNVWTDVNRMLTLNSEQARRNIELHVCPLQFDTVDRLIDRYSNPDELVFDPFCGIGTTPHRALLKGRRGAGVELHEQYFKDAVRYLRATEAEVSVPDLFGIQNEKEAA